MSTPSMINQDQALAFVDSLMSARSSCRAFHARAVPRNTILQMLEIAQRTASWCNSQPWQVIITQGESTERFRESFYAHAKTGATGISDFPFPTQYRGAYLQRRRAAGSKLYEALGIGREDIRGKNLQALENYRFFGAPHVAIITADAALGPYGAIDCGGYVTSFLLAAQAAGVATIAQAALAHYSDFVRKYLDIPDDRRVVCGVSFGYADPAHPANGVRTDRASVLETVTFLD